jgi:excisionase family DNA binding protein
VAEHILTLSQLAVYMDVPRRRLYRLIAGQHRFPVIKHGRRWCADVDVVREWLLQEFDEDKDRVDKRDKRRKRYSTNADG